MNQKKFTDEFYSACNNSKALEYLLDLQMYLYAGLAVAVIGFGSGALLAATCISCFGEVTFGEVWGSIQNRVPGYNIPSVTIFAGFGFAAAATASTLINRHPGLALVMMAFGLASAVLGLTEGYAVFASFTMPETAIYITSPITKSLLVLTIALSVLGSVTAGIWGNFYVRTSLKSSGRTKAVLGTLMFMALALHFAVFLLPTELLLYAMPANVIHLLFTGGMEGLLAFSLSLDARELMVLLTLAYCTLLAMANWRSMIDVLNGRKGYTRFNVTGVLLLAIITTFAVLLDRHAGSGFPEFDVVANAALYLTGASLLLTIGTLGAVKYLR